MWWTTGVGYDPARVDGTPTSSNGLWDPRWAKHIAMLDDWQEVFGLTLIQLGHSANTDDTAELDEALALLEEQKPLVRVYSTDTITTMTSGDVWIGHIWGADRYRDPGDDPDFAYYIPEEGGVKGYDTIATFTGAPHPNAAQLFINHLLDAEQSAANTNSSTTWARTRRPRSSSTRRSSTTRRSTPTRRSSTSSRSCLTSTRASATST